MREVWIHWSQGLWLVTTDGMDLIEKVPRVVLRGVRFVIDPVGLKISRETGKRKTHAWAAGEPVEWTPDPTLTQLAWHPLDYRPRRGDESFHLGGQAVFGAKYLEAFLIDGWDATALIAGPYFGETERRQVQQYGGRPR